MTRSEITDFEEIFDSIKKLISKYHPLLIQEKVKTTKPQYHLWSKDKILIDNRKPKNIYFAGTIIQKNFVGFYYMPVYTDTKLKDFFEPELLSMLRGKSCFHIKKLDFKIKRQIENALRLGFKHYKKRKWI
ncbi:hypothetical protein [Nitrosopumilus sp.]|uniref:hypothetical protein n=1 Tax=Nitrosopumilus sp. TaxID=2024843 RepID=UPI00292D0E63|nr:hypothetical protein [Nitrosopumilus sp.]